MSCAKSALFDIGTYITYNLCIGTVDWAVRQEQVNDVRNFKRTENKDNV